MGRNVSASATFADRINKRDGATSPVSNTGFGGGQRHDKFSRNGLIRRMALLECQFDRQALFIDHRMDPFTQSHTRSIDSVVRAPFLSARSVLLSPDDGTVNELKGLHRLIGQIFKHPEPDACLCPPVIAIANRRMGTISLREITPR